MAIYHLEAKIISRGTGRSAVAVAAYMGCDVITKEYDGITHDYTSKGGQVWAGVVESWDALERRGAGGENEG